MINYLIISISTLLISPVKLMPFLCYASFSNLIKSHSPFFPLCPSLSELFSTFSPRAEWWRWPQIQLRQRRSFEIAKRKSESCHSTRERQEQRYALRALPSVIARERKLDQAFTISRHYRKKRNHMEWYDDRRHDHIVCLVLLRQTARPNTQWNNRWSSDTSRDFRRESDL